MASKTWHTVEFSRNRHTPLRTDLLVDPSSGAAVLLYSPALPHSTSGRCDSRLRVPHPAHAAQAAACRGLGLSFRDRPPGRWPSVSVPPWQRGETLRGSRAVVKRPASAPLGVLKPPLTCSFVRRRASGEPSRRETDP